MLRKSPRKRDNIDYLIISEYRLLNALIYNPDFLKNEKIEESLFIHDLAKSYFQAIKYFIENNLRITKASLTQKANEINYLANFDITEKIFDIESKDNVYNINLDDIINVLLEAKKIKDLNDITGKLYKQIKDLQVLDYSNKTPTEILETQTNIKTNILSNLYQIEQIISNNINEKNTLLSLEEWFSNYEEELERRISCKDYTYGDPFLDSLNPKGPYPGSITIIAGSTGMGKSTLALNIFNNCINREIPCIYFSLEMSNLIMMDRLISNRLGIPTSDLNNKNLIPYIQKKVKEEREKLKNIKYIYFDDDASLNIPKLVNKINRFKQKIKEDYAIIIIDLLTQLKEFTAIRNGLNLAQCIEIGMNELNIVAKNLNVHIIGVVQFNRETDNEKIEKLSDVYRCRPMLNNIKNANAIAERARIVFGTFRPRYYIDKYLPDDETAQYVDDIMEVNTLKISDGAPKRVSFLFEGNVFRITGINESINNTSNMVNEKDLNIKDLSI